MSLLAWTLLLLGTALGLGLWRTRGRGALRRALLQVATVALLYPTLFPPSLPEAFNPGELRVLTPVANPAEGSGGTSFPRKRESILPPSGDARIGGLEAGRTGQDPTSASRAVALPGAQAPPSVERTPDLATALRRHPEVTRLAVAGGGLPARDRDAARGRVVAFDAAPLPSGVVELAVPPSLMAGQVWSVDGRVEGAPGGTVELQDPGGTRVASASLGEEGAFRLSATAKIAGPALYTLSVMDSAGEPVERIVVPVAVRTGSPLRVLLLAGAPDAELKYFRRWAVDADLDVHSRIGLSEGVALREGAGALDPATLADSDVVLIDARAWAGLASAERDGLLAAVRHGLGLLLRPTGSLPPEVAADWARLGFRFEPAEARAVRLDARLGLAASGPAFSQQAFTVAASDAAPLLRADDGSVLAWSRLAGEGRAGLWLLADAWKLGLAGDSAAYGTLWSDTLAAIARPRDDAPPELRQHAWVGERVLVCSLKGSAIVVDGDGNRTPLRVDDDGCAGFWPWASGWHMLESGGETWPFHVRERDEAVALHAAETRRGTQALLGTSHEATPSASRDVPLPRWPFFLAFLAVAALLWWLERKAGGATAAA
ncbi:MAG: hypothetical protein J0H15_09070 [Xanthomonadales bacterium]|nr:hypothetical protein [Xanthomonadales bacterium]